MNETTKDDESRIVVSTVKEGKGARSISVGTGTDQLFMPRRCE